MAGKGGGAWKVAYADFVTAMMAFFMVMWLVSQNQDIKESVAHHFSSPYTPFIPSSRRSGDPSSMLPFKSNGQMMNRKNSQNGMRTRGFQAGDPSPQHPPGTDEDDSISRQPRLHDSERTGIGAVILFPEDTAELSDLERSRLKYLVPNLAGKPNKIEIRGHAARKPLPPDSPYKDTWHLSYERCLAAMKYLEQEGIDPERIRLSQAGPFEPHTIREDPKHQTHNSRVEVQMLREYTEDLIGTKEERAARVESE